MGLFCSICISSYIRVNNLIVPSVNFGFFLNSVPLVTYSHELVAVSGNMVSQ